MMNTKDARENLRERTGYEVFLLREVYRLDQVWAASRHVEEYRYCSGELGITSTVGISLDFSFGRPVVEIIGKPILFVSAFKLLDMLLEWVIAGGGPTPDRIHYSKKRKKFDNKDFSDLLLNNPWLKLVTGDIFECLLPYRSVIIHRHSFGHKGENLVIKDEEDRTELSISGETLRDLADFAVSVVLLIQGDRAFDEVEEARLMCLSDRLNTLHTKEKFAAVVPNFAQLTYVVVGNDDSGMDLPSVLALAQSRGRRPLCFDVVVCHRDLDQSKAWRIRHDKVADLPEVINVEIARSCGVEEPCSKAMLAILEKGRG